MSKQTLAVCLVLHNEGRLIRRCLESVYKLADEIIVVHDGPCADNTLEIAKEFKANIIVAPRSIGIAEFGRVISYEAATSDWILQIDGDEFLSSQLQEAIPKLIQNENVDAYEFAWPLYNGNNYTTKNWPFKRALFRRTKMSYIGVPHYVVEVSGKVTRLSLVLEHQPEYDSYSWSVFKKKWTAWAHIQAQMMVKDFSEIPQYNCRYTNWPGNLKLRREHPLLIMFFDGPAIFIKILVSGAWRQGLSAWKMALFFGLFRTIIDWNIFRLK